MCTRSAVRRRVCEVYRREGHQKAATPLVALSAHPWRERAHNRHLCSEKTDYTQT